MSGDNSGLAPLEVANLAKGLSDYLKNCVSRSDLPGGLKKLYVGISNMLNIYIGIFEKIRVTFGEIMRNIIDKTADLQLSLGGNCEVKDVVDTLKKMLTIAKRVAESNLLNQIALLSVYYSQFIDVLNTTIEIMEKEKNQLEKDADLFQCDVCGYISIRERPVRCPICNESGKNFKTL